jgi:hypothetical protein
MRPNHSTRNTVRLLPAALAAAAIATAAGSVNVGAAPAATPIQHVVVIYQENHTFNEVLGWMCVTDATRCAGTDTGTLPSGQSIALQTAPNIVPQVDHDRTTQTTAIDGGRRTGSARSTAAPRPTATPATSGTAGTRSRTSRCSRSNTGSRTTRSSKTRSRAEERTSSWLPGGSTGSTATTRRSSRATPPDRGGDAIASATPGGAPRRVRRASSFHPGSPRPTALVRTDPAARARVAPGPSAPPGFHLIGAHRPGPVRRLSPAGVRTNACQQ